MRAAEPSRAAPGTGVALGVTFATGVGIAAQAFVNGRLGGSLDAAPLAAMVNNGVGLCVLVALGLATGAFLRGGRRFKVAPRPRAWHFLGGPLGAFLVYVLTVGPPRVGVAVLTVALVGGQTVGSLVVDAAGLSPAGHRPLTRARLVGVMLAVVAVTLAATGASGDLELPILSLAFATGIGTAFQQAANGQLAHSSGEPVVAGAINFALGGIVLTVFALSVTGGEAPGGWSAPPWQFLGGVFGMAAVVTAAWSVASLGVLRLTLAIVAGQSAGALAFDLVAPAPGEAVTVSTVLGVVLTLIAVAASGRGPRPS